MAELKIELNLEQQVEVQKLRLFLQEASKEQIAETAVSLMIQKFGFQNAYTSVLKSVL